MKKFIFSFAVVALLVGAMTLVPQMSAQDTTPAPAPAAQDSTPAQTPTAQQDQPASGSSMDQPMAATKSFTGTIEKDGDKLVLKDATSNVTYQLDDQTKAKKFVGKSVQVMGSLDTTGSTIHVSDIKAGS